MSTGWTVASLGMLAGGLGIAVYGWRAREGCYGYREYDERDDFRRKYYAVGGILIGSGATLFVIAESKRGARRMSIGVTEGRLTLQHRVAF